MSNHYCEMLKIDVPVLEDLKDHRKANAFSLLIITLLERGEPMTLAEVADRFVEAGIAPCETALLSLTRCRPARAPVYRDGHRYGLDPHAEELDWWIFRFGLRPPKFQKAPVVQPEPLPGPEVPLTIEELDPYPWSKSRNCRVEKDVSGFGLVMLDEDGLLIDDRDVQLARLSETME